MTPAPVRTVPDETDQSGTVKQMAEHLVAGICHGRLNTASDRDVIAYLYDLPNRYHYRVVLDSYAEAVYEAKQIMIAMEMSKA